MVVGDRFARLVVVAEDVRRNRFGEPYHLCRCDCGNEKTIKRTSLRTGSTRSCGCINREITAARNRTHGLSHLPEYGIWCGIIKRCENPNEPGFKNYGGRGIGMCERWRCSFPNFLADMGGRTTAKHTIERRDNDGDYEPGNCRWATWKEQMANRRPFEQPHGSMVKTSKLTEEQVVDILDRIVLGEQSQKAIAEMFGVTATLITNIKKSKAWAHVARPEALR